MRRRGLRQAAGDHPQEIVSSSMTEGIIDGFEVVEIEHQERPGAGLITRQTGQCLIKACPIGQLSQCIDMGHPVALENALMALEGDGTQVDARVYDPLLGCGRSPVLPKIEREGA